MAWRTNQKVVAVCGAILAGCAVILAACSAAVADVRLPAIFSDHMVLQQGIKVPVWGWAEAGEKVAVALGGEKAEAAADKDGRWQVTFGPMKAGGPIEMTVAGKNTITVKDILVGEVWICSGQSNMEMGLGGVRNAREEIAAANYPKIRMFTVNRTFSLDAKTDCRGSWAVSGPGTAAGFSAVGYFFGRDLHKVIDVPVGLIHTSWGGTVCEAWTSRAGLEAVADLKPIFDRLVPPPGGVRKAQEAYADAMKKWEDAAYVKDPGNKGYDQGWAKPDLDTADWKEMDTPGMWEEKAKLDLDGAVWMRRTVAIPAAWAGKELMLSLGAIDDFDTTYFNNEKVGATGRERPNWWMAERRYRVPASLVKEGKATIAVRVFDQYLGGGLAGPAESMHVGPVGGPASDAISLAGPWRYKVEFEVQGTRTIPPQPGTPPGIVDQNSPTALYNTMINPLIPFAIRGAIWYQGESNAGRAYQYRKLFPAMITDWRKRWGEGDFPFLFVQLANFTPRAAQPGPSDWAELREAQLMTLALPKTGMAVIIDIGEAADIHPKNKQDVGGRLALAAEAIVYERMIEDSGPMYESMKVEDGKIRLKFSHCGGGRPSPDAQQGPNPLTAGRMTEKGFEATGAKLVGFAIAGEDKKFVWADAKIDAATGDSVIVSSPEVAKPVAVRYAWANNPDCNLYSKAGLPASPFRTDDWPGITVNNK